MKEIFYNVIIFYLFFFAYRQHEEMGVIDWSAEIIAGDYREEHKVLLACEQGRLKQYRKESIEELTKRLNSVAQ